MQMDTDEQASCGAKLAATFKSWPPQGFALRQQLQVSHGN